MGKVEGLRVAVVSVVEVRFPSLVGLAQQKVIPVKKLYVLNLLLKAIKDAPDENAAYTLLKLVAARK